MGAVLGGGAAGSQPDRLRRKRGGPALSVCVGGAPEELDPIYATETADQTVLVHLYENLMRKTGDGSGGDHGDERRKPRASVRRRMPTAP